MNSNYYHGTSTKAPIKRFILPPNMTGMKRETFRTKQMDTVFLTQSLKSAQRYANLAAEYFGGEPVVYKCIPKGINIAYNNNGECLCDVAEIIGFGKGYNNGI